MNVGAKEGQMVLNYMQEWKAKVIQSC